MLIIKYPFLSDNKKSEILLDIARNDSFFSDILNELEAKSFTLDFSWKIANGLYHPKIIRIDNKNYKPDKPIHITLSRRGGLCANIYHFIHELIHYYQDKNEMLLNPVIYKDKPLVIPSYNNAIKIYLFAEAMATVESIRVSYSLKLNKIPYPWWGCYYSMDWHFLSKLYCQTYKIGEEVAIRSIFSHWYKGRHVRNYKKLAESYYDSLKKVHDYIVDETVTLKTMVNNKEDIFSKYFS